MSAAVAPVSILQTYILQLKRAVNVHEVVPDWVIGCRNTFSREIKEKNKWKEGFVLILQSFLLSPKYWNQEFPKIYLHRSLNIRIDNIASHLHCSQVIDLQQERL